MPVKKSFVHYIGISDLLPSMLWSDLKGPLKKNTSFIVFVTSIVNLPFLLL